MSVFIVKDLKEKLKKANSELVFLRSTVELQLNKIIKLEDSVKTYKERLGMYTRIFAKYTRLKNKWDKLNQVGLDKKKRYRAPTQYNFKFIYKTDVDYDSYIIKAENCETARSIFKKHFSNKIMEVLNLGENKSDR